MSKTALCIGINNYPGIGMDLQGNGAKRSSYSANDASPYLSDGAIN